MKKQPDVTDATRNAFINAFFQLAKKKNINQITIREITNLAGYNRTTFYRYFDDVFALIEYAEDEFFEYTRNKMKELGGASAVYNKQFFETFINCFHEKRNRILILMSEQNRSHFIRRIRENVIDHMGWKIADTPKKNVVTNMFLFGTFAAIGVNLQDNDALSDEDLLSIIQKLFTKWYLPEINEENSLII